MATNKMRRAECQACAQQQAIDRSNRMMHHGYQRPGHGYIEGDCIGVGELPYQLSCDVTKRWLSELETRVASWQENLSALESDTVDVMTVVTKISHGHIRGGKTPGQWEAEGFKPVTKRSWGVVGWEKTFVFEVGRNHVPSKERGEQESDFYTKGHNFEYYRRQKMLQLQQKIQAAGLDIVILTTRVENWTYAPEKIQQP